MLIKILIAIAAIVIVFLIVAAMRPSNFRVTRSASIPASSAAVFPHVNNLHKFQDWSPWAKMDPAAKTAFEGPPEGTGAAFRWAGNKNVGEGRMILTESRPNELIRFRLEFIKPFAGTNTAEFTFQPEGNQTTVTWSMSGKNNFLMKAVGMFLNCDKMVGGQFEQGLANLKAVATGAKP